jgi:hypothetical protein
MFKTTLVSVSSEAPTADAAEERPEALELCLAARPLAKASMSATTEAESLILDAALLSPVGCFVGVHTGGAIDDDAAPAAEAAHPATAAFRLVPAPPAAFEPAFCLATAASPSILALIHEDATPEEEDAFCKERCASHAAEKTVCIRGASLSLKPDQNIPEAGIKPNSEVPDQETCGKPGSEAKLCGHLD